VRDIDAGLHYTI